MLSSFPGFLNRACAHSFLMPVACRSGGLPDTDTVVVIVRPARWGDVVRALELENEALGQGVAWDPSRVRSWWDADLLTAFAAETDGLLVGYASAARLDEGTFEAIVGGRLAPEELEVPRNVDGGFFWVGIVLVLPEFQGRGVGAELLTRLVTSQPGRYVADVYSDAGAALVEKLGWVRVRDGQHPLYQTMSPV